MAASTDMVDRFLRTARCPWGEVGGTINAYGIAIGALLHILPPETTRMARGSSAAANSIWTWVVNDTDGSVVFWMRCRHVGRHRGWPHPRDFVSPDAGNRALFLSRTTRSPAVLWSGVLFFPLRRPSAKRRLFVPLGAQLPHPDPPTQTEFARAELSASWLWLEPDLLGRVAAANAPT